jgi:hypothetical protein
VAVSWKIWFFGELFPGAFRGNFKVLLMEAFHEFLKAFKELSDELFDQNLRLILQSFRIKAFS